MSLYTHYYNGGFKLLFGYGYKGEYPFLMDFLNGLKMFGNIT